MRRVNILIIEDDSDIRDKLSKILEEDGYRVASAATGTEGIRKVKSEDFDIVITDLVMPDIDGMHVLKEVKMSKPETCVIMITAFATIENAVEAMKMGASNYISKPFKINEVQVAIRRALEEAKFGQRELEKPAPDLQLLYSDSVSRAIINPIRKKIIGYLYDHEKSRFTDIKQGLGMDLAPKLAFHVRELKSAGLLAQDGERRYSLSATGKKVAETVRLTS